MMDTLLYQGDHATDARGIPVAITGAQELIQRALLRLGIRRGSFAYDRNLGSELYRLSHDTSSATHRAARSYVQEALIPLPELMIGDIDCKIERDRMRITVELSHSGRRYWLEIPQQISC